jgi:hypothetical protein
MISMMPLMMPLMKHQFLQHDKHAGKDTLLKLRSLSSVHASSQGNPITLSPILDYLLQYKSLTKWS